MSDWWYCRSVEHGYAIVMPDGGELIVPDHVARRFAAMVWHTTTPDQHGEATEAVRQSLRARHEEQARRQETKQLGAVLTEEDGPEPLERQPDLIVDLTTHGDSHEPLPE